MREAVKCGGKNQKGKDESLGEWRKSEKFINCQDFACFEQYNKVEIGGIEKNSRLKKKPADVSMASVIQVTKD